MVNETLEAEGTITSVLGNNNYRVSVQGEEGKRDILCHLSGRMRRFKISIVAGDTVKVSIPPPYDKGRITFRER